MRWPCGALEIERGKRREAFSAREAETLERWCDPQALELVAGTPVNCLVVTWAEGSEGDEGQQRALAPLIAAARRRGLSVVGWVGTGADLKRATGAAQASGLEAIATESSEPVPGGAVLRFRERGLGDRSPSDFLGVASTVWPGASASLPTGADAASGPTGPPWLDSNAWYVRLVRTLVDPKVLWLAFDPPDLGQPVAAASYVQAIADTEICGARWVVWLDPHMRRDLLDRRASALETWAGIGRSLAGSSGSTAPGRAISRSDSSGWCPPTAGPTSPCRSRCSTCSPGRAVSTASSRRAGALGRSSTAWTPFSTWTVLLPGDLARKLYAFAEGGTLITPPGWEERGVTEGDSWLSRFRAFQYGRGRLAVAREELADPYLLAEDAQLLMSHRRDRVRLFNAGTAQFHHATSGDGRSGVLHALVYPMPYPRGEMTASFLNPWAHARVFMVETAAPALAGRTEVAPGVEFHLPPVPVYCALEVSA